MSMFFTRSDKTLRVWFAAVTSAGAYRTGLNTSNFLAQIVNPADSANITVGVSESSQRSGVYYFDIPATFLTTNGIGDYLASVKIDSTSGTNSGAPQLKSIESNVLHVTREDFDTISGSVWSTPNGAFNVTGTMGALQNLIAQVDVNTQAAAIASAVWNSVAASFNTSGTFGWIQNQLYLSAAQEVTTDTIVSGVWNANLSSFNSVGSFGGAVNEALQDIKFHMSSTFVASASILSIAASRTWVSTSIANDPGQFNGMLLMIKSPLSGVQVRIIDTFLTGVFDVEPGFTFGTASDGVFVISTQFVPGRGYIG